MLSRHKGKENTQNWEYWVQVVQRLYVREARSLDNILLGAVKTNLEEK